MEIPRVKDSKNPMDRILTPRLFIGIPLTEPARKLLKVQSWPGLSRYKKEKMSSQHHWQITLAYIGQTPEDNLNKIKQLFADFEPPPAFKTSIRSFGGFPQLEMAKVLWAGLNKNNDKIINLANEIRSSLDRLDISYDNKEFVPHITMCHLRSPKNLSRLKDDGKMKQDIPLEVKQINLYQSFGRTRPYEIISSLELLDN